MLIFVSSLRKILSRIFKALPLNSFNIPIKTSADGEEPSPAPNTIHHKLLISDIINHTLDDEIRIKNTEIQTKTLEVAAMNRAMQYYFSQLDVGVNEENLSNEEKSPTDTPSHDEPPSATLGSLKDFPLPIVLRIHRELCGKKFIAKRVAGSKRKVWTIDKIRLIYDIRG